MLVEMQGSRHRFWFPATVGILHFLELEIQGVGLHTLGVAMTRRQSYLTFHHTFVPAGAEAACRVESPGMVSQLLSWWYSSSNQKKRDSPSLTVMTFNVW